MCPSPHPTAPHLPIHPVRDNLTALPNFTGGSRITLLILFVVAAGFWLGQYRQKRNVAKQGSEETGKSGFDWRFWLCLGLLIVHLVNTLLVLIVSGPTNINLI